MHNLRDLTAIEAKAAAKRLRDALAAKNIDLSHGDCLDLLARQLGHRDWNVLSAQLHSDATESAGLAAPDGWTVGGTAKHLYEGGLLSGAQHAGKPVVSLKSRERARAVQSSDGFVTFMQSISATPHLGKRLKIACFIKAIAVAGSATIWLRFDGPSGQMLGFSNLENEPPLDSLSGTVDWCGREIVLDVPEGTSQIVFGFYLSGAGEAQFAGFSFTDVTADNPVTVNQLPEQPRNLGFTERAN
ncbi:MAG: glyoxalase superfamily protein [Rhizobiaceae bacterium]